MSFRKEKKYKVTKSELIQLKAILLTQGMSQIYDPRLIRSVYFDTPNLQMFYDSEEGTLPRKKIRFRSYNSSNDFSLETKISSIEGRFKKTKPVKGILEEQTLFQHQILDQNYGKIYPSLDVTYMREYYILHNIRITFDTNIKYKRLRRDLKSFNDNENVVEVKMASETSDDYLETFFSRPTFRFSKYSRGLLV